MLTNQLDEHDLVAVHGDDELDRVIFPAVHNLARLWQIPRQLVHLCNLFRCQLLRRSSLFQRFQGRDRARVQEPNRLLRLRLDIFGLQFREGHFGRL